MSYNLEEIFNLLSYNFENEITKMKLFLDIKNHPDYLNKEMFIQRNFKNWTNDLHKIGLNEFSNVEKTSLFKVIIIHSLFVDVEIKEIKLNKKKLHRLIINFLGRLFRIKSK